MGGGGRYGWTEFRGVEVLSDLVPLQLGSLAGWARRRHKRDMAVEKETERIEITWKQDS
jgi:hypothetical protein